MKQRIFVICQTFWLMINLEHPHKTLMSNERMYVVFNKVQIVYHITQYKSSMMVIVNPYLAELLQT